MLFMPVLSIDYNDLFSSGFRQTLVERTHAVPCIILLINITVLEISFLSIALLHVQIIKTVIIVHFRIIKCSIFALEKRLIGTLYKLLSQEFSAALLFRYLLIVLRTAC